MKDLSAFSVELQNSGSKALVLAQLNLDSTGVIYTEGSLKLVIPWSALDRQRPVQASDGGWLFPVKDARLGRAVLLESGSLDLASDTELSHLNLVDGALFLKGNLDPACVAAIVKGRNQYFQRVEQVLHQMHPKPTALRIRSVNADRQTCLIDPAAKLDFPSFCPNTGQRCGELTWCSLAGSDEQICWVVSPQSRWWELWRPRFQLAIAVLAMLVIWIAGYAYFLAGEPLSDYTQIFLLLGGILLLILPLSIGFKTNGLRLRRDLADGEAIAAYMRDPEYFASFVELNR